MNTGSMRRCFTTLLGVISLAGASKVARAQGNVPCPDYFFSFYRDPALGMIFVGESDLVGTLPTGEYVYKFTGRNTINEMKVVAYHRVASSQCEDAWMTRITDEPAYIQQFYSAPPTYPAPQWFADPPNVACGYGGGEGGGWEPTDRMVPTPAFDCAVGGGGGDGTDNSTGFIGVVTVTTCYYSAVYDGGGNYMYTELEYCSSYSYVMT